uniref:Uncharacterized protein n=1 Tax=Candidatus Kentrum sp. LFY TaxID=2126342 RepID=A0A450UEV6_9GAMM|nr:MAG: hypothetical protein BECKLFY1418B_GA0070995_10238 [Candidatus Kentron sp. LFY]
MNTTKLHIIARVLRDELARSETVSILNETIQALQHLVENPHPEYQEQLAAHLSNLYKRLETSPVDDFSPAWRDAVDELGVADEFGSRLVKKIKNIFERNPITPQMALKELEQIRNRLSSTESNLNRLVSGLEYFGVAEDELCDDECEIGIIVPRSYVKDNLKSFGSELVELEKSLLVFSELVTGQREPLKIRQISSSELSIFLDYIPGIGACIAIAVERIVALYKQVLEIKNLKKGLVDQKLPEDVLKGIDDHAKSMVKPELEKLATELMEKYGEQLESERKNEVSTELRHSLNKIANRIDRGFNVELRVAPPKEEPEENQDLDNADRNRLAAVRKIIESASKIAYLEKSGEPVLFLPENEENDK